MSNKDVQIALVNGAALTERDMFSAVDGVVAELNQTGNIQKATQVVSILDRIDNVTGHAKAKLLHGMSAWYKTNKPQDDFGDYIESTTSTKRVTVERYVNVWEQIEQERIPKNIQERPMRDLVPIANMLAQGFEPSKAEWGKINLAANPSELSEVIRAVKGKKPRKSGMTIQLERDGSLYAFKDNKRVYVGYLDLTEWDELKLKAIERILDGAQIIRK